MRFQNNNEEMKRERPLLFSDVYGLHLLNLKQEVEKFKISNQNKLIWEKRKNEEKKEGLTCE